MSGDIHVRRQSSSIFVELRSVVLDLVPRHLGADVDVPLFFGRVSWMSVDRARRVSDLIRLAVVIDEQLAAAGPAKATMDLLRRVEGVQVVLALLDLERRSRNVGVGGEQRAVHAPVTCLY